MSKTAAFIEKLGIYTVGVLAVVFSFFLSVNSLLHTTAVDIVGPGDGIQSSVYNIYEMLESVIYYNDNLFLNLAVLALSLLAGFIIIAKCQDIRLRHGVLFLFLWTFALGTIWVLSSQSAPTEDSAMVTMAAADFAQDNFYTFDAERYFHVYAFQLGYVWFNELIIRFISLFTEVENLLFLQVLNAVFLAIINVFILLINNKIFHDRRVNVLTACILACSTAPIISCSFVYGIFPGMMFAVIAVYCELCFLKDNKLWCGILSAVCIAVAVLLKSNYMIWLIAMVLIAVSQYFKRKHYIKDALIILLTLVLSLTSQPAVKAMYEQRSGIDLGDSIPYVSWIAMGLNESPLAPGWYNYVYTVTNFERHDDDAKAASTASAEEVKNRIQHFIENPQYASDFFYLKVTSQWNDTSYQSIWNNEVRSQYGEKNALASWVCGDGERIVEKGMDYFAQLVFCAFCIGCIYAVKRKNLFALVLPLIFVGGFMYQLISEGKSQYILPYFIVMSGAAAYGMVMLFEKTSPLLRRHRVFNKLLSEPALGTGGTQ